MPRTLTHNVSGYARFQAASSLFGWISVFFLFFSQHVGLPEVIQLGAIYYLSVCFWEVPSGYFSDRIGRRPTLILAAVAFVVANVTFLFAGTFTALATGQCFLALGMAMLSGTDTAFLYDSLLALGREQEYGDQEARGQAFGLGALSFAAFTGGLLGLIDLRFAYLFSLVGALWTLWLAWRFVEPPVHGTDKALTTSPVATLRACFSHLRDRLLGWLFGVMVLMYCLEHVVYEFYQPYIQLLDIRWFTDDSSSLISGIVLALSMFGGSLGAAYSVRIARRFGLKTLLFSAFAFQLTIITGVSLVAAPAMLIVILIRNFPMAMIHAPVNAAIAPRIGSHLRATYLSLQSLFGRLGFALLLFFLSSLVPDNAHPDWQSLSTILRTALYFGLGGVTIALLFAPPINDRDYAKSIEQ